LVFDKYVKKKGGKITPFLWFDNKAEEAAQFYIRERTR